MAAATRWDGDEIENGGMQRNRGYVGRVGEALPPGLGWRNIWAVALAVPL